MTHHAITSDTHFAMLHPPRKADDITVNALIASLGLSHNAIRPVDRSYKDLPDMAPAGPATLHRVIHLGDFT